MRIICAILLVQLFWTAAPALSQDAMDYYRRGLKSTLAVKKVEYFTEAIRLNPRLKEAYEARAVHYYFQQRLDEAIEDYTWIIELDPGHTDAYLMRGLARLKKGHPEGFMGELYRLAPSLARLWVQDTSGSLREAIRDFTKAIELSPGLARAYSHRAQAYLFERMLAEALRDANRAIALRADDKSSAYAYATRAEIHRRRGQDELYEADFQRSIELAPFTFTPDYPPLHVPLSLRYPQDIASLKSVCRAGLIGVLVLALAVIFGVRLPRPKKDDQG